MPPSREHDWLQWPGPTARCLQGLCRLQALRRAVEMPRLSTAPAASAGAAGRLEAGAGAPVGDVSQHTHTWPLPVARASSP